MSVTIEKPVRPAARKSNREKAAWIFMRASGVLLVVLIFGHLFVNLLTSFYTPTGDPNNGIGRVSWGFVAGKLANPFWQVWDILLLWLSLLHGANGMRTIVNDYVSRPGVQKGLRIAIFVVAFLLIILGTWTVFWFSPCDDPVVKGWESFCQAVNG